jgi:hypothetical protein
MVSEAYRQCVLVRSCWAELDNVSRATSLGSWGYRCLSADQWM